MNEELRAEWEHEVGEGDCTLTFEQWMATRLENGEEPCCMTLCEWPAITTRGQRHLCAQCAEAFDAGALYAQTETKGNP